MILKIAKKDLPAIQQACALSDMLLETFTIETNAGLIGVQITELDGRELKLEYAFRIGQRFEAHCIASMHC